MRVLLGTQAADSDPGQANAEHQRGERSKRPANDRASPPRRPCERGSLTPATHRPRLGITSALAGTSRPEGSGCASPRALDLCGRSREGGQSGSEEGGLARPRRRVRKTRISVAVYTRVHRRVGQQQPAEQYQRHAGVSPSPVSRIATISWSRGARRLVLKGFLVPSRLHHDDFPSICPTTAFQ